MLMIQGVQITPIILIKFEECLIQQQLMIKGRKIQPQSVNFVIPAKKNINSMEGEKVGLQSGSYVIGLQPEQKKEFNEIRIDNMNESQNHQNMLNKQKDIKENRNQGQKIVNDKPKTSQRKKSAEQTRRAQPQHHKNNAFNKAQVIHDRKTSKMMKPESKDARSTKQKIQQVLKQQEMIRKTLKKQPSQTNQKFHDIPVKDKLQQLKNDVSELAQQKWLQQQEDGLQEIQRQIFPNPIQNQLIQQQQLEQDEKGLDIYLESSFEEDFSFLAPASSQTEETPNLPINMDLFQLTADQLLALDYFQV